MKTLRLVGKLLAIGLLVLGINSSCKKDKDENCITCTFTYEDGSTETDKVCDGDQEEWGMEDVTWDEFVALIRAADPFSDEFSCD